MAFASLLVGLLPAPLLFGGAFGSTVVLITTLEALALLGVLAATRLHGRAPGIAWVLFGVTLFTLFQALPLPRGVTELLSAPAVEAADRSARALTLDPPGWVALSVDPGMTQQKALEASGILCAFLSGLLVARAGGRTLVLQVAALSALGVLLVSLLHLLAGAEAIYGVREPRYVSANIPSPLMNENHLGGFATFGTVLCLGLSARARAAPWPALYLLAATSLAALSFATLSRGAVVATCVGVVATTVFTLRLWRRQEPRETRPRFHQLLWGFAGLVLVGAAALWVGLAAIGAELESGDVHKLSVIGAASRLAWEHPILGVGRGAFSAAFAGVMGVAQRYVHPENLLVQWLTEWGAPVAIAFLVAVALPVLDALFRSRSLARTVGAVALVVLAGQNLVDFGLELEGIAVVAAAVLGAVSVSRRQQRSEGGESGRASRALYLSIAPATLFVLLFLGPSVWGGDVLTRTERLERHLAEGESAHFRHLLEESMLRHPAEPNFPLLGAAWAVSNDIHAAPRLINRALALAPSWSGPHEVAARFLLRIGRVDQALLELREAEERQPFATLQRVCELLDHAPRADASWAFRAAPRGPRRPEYLDRLTTCLPAGSVTAEVIDEELALLGPFYALRVAIRKARRLRRAQRPEDAVALLEPLLDASGSDAELLLELAAAHRGAGRAEVAAELIERAVNASDEPSSDMLRELAIARAVAQDAEGAEDALRRLTRLAAGDPHRLARARQAEGRVNEALGRHQSAIRAYREAARLGGELGPLRRAARLAEAHGSPAQAYQLYSTVCRLSDGRSRECRRAEALRNTKNGRLAPRGGGALP